MVADQPTTFHMHPPPWMDSIFPMSYVSKDLCVESNRQGRTFFSSTTLKGTPTQSFPLPFTRNRIERRFWLYCIALLKKGKNWKHANQYCYLIPLSSISTWMSLLIPTCPKNKEYNCLTFAIPSHDCLEDILDDSWASGIYNESGKHAVIISSTSMLERCCLYPLTLQTPQATVHSSEVADAWLAWHSIPNCIYIYISIMLVLCSGIPLTKIHNVISANGTVVDDDIYHFIINHTLHMDIIFLFTPSP